MEYNNYELFNLLPAEVWTNIFSMIRQWSLLSSVCRRWRDIIKSVPRKTITNGSIRIESLSDYDTSIESIRLWIVKPIICDGIIDRLTFDLEISQQSKAVFDLFFAGIASNSLPIIEDINKYIGYICHYSFYDRLRYAVISAVENGISIEMLRCVLIDCLRCKDYNRLTSANPDRYTWPRDDDKTIARYIPEYIDGSGSSLILAKIVGYSIRVGNHVVVDWFMKLFSMNIRSLFKPQFLTIFKDIIYFSCIVSDEDYNLRWAVTGDNIDILQSFILKNQTFLSDSSNYLYTDIVDELFKNIDDCVDFNDQTNSPYYKILISTIIIGNSGIFKSVEYEESIIAVGKSIEYVNGIDRSAFGEKYRDIIFEFLCEEYPWILIF